ncbi:pfs domain-containing protein [Trichoderma velutinum]
MTSSSVTIDDVDSIQLLITTSKIIMDVARVLWTEEIDYELKSFYSSVKTLCFIANSHWKHASEVAYRIDADLLHRTLALLDSAIASDIFYTPFFKAFPSARRYEKLYAFNREWERMQKQSDNNTALQDIRFCLTFETYAKERDRLIQLLDEYTEELPLYPENQSDWAPKELSTNASVGSSSIAVWSAAQSIFKAFAACSNCECTPTHKSRAQLRLGTYRKHTIRRGGVNECLDFDMFLSIKQSWTAARVFTVKKMKESLIQIHTNNSGQQPETTKIRQKRIRQLCEPIDWLEIEAHKRLNLKVAGGQIFQLQSEGSTFLVDRAKSPETLEHFLRNKPHLFTGKTKHILTVMLSYAVLYLHDTPWLHPTWSSSHVLFLPTTSSFTPLRPFVQTYLANHYESSQDSCIDPDDLDPDNSHSCPLLVTLAVMLMELQFAVPFDILAKRYNMDLRGDTQSYVDVNIVFDKCKAEVSELYQFHSVVEKCLDPRTWEDEDGNKLDSEALMSKIYQEVVKPLEIELSHAFSKISSDDLDEFAMSINIAHWGQNIQQQAKIETQEDHTGDVKQTNQRKRPRSMSPGNSPRSSGSEFVSQYPGKRHTGSRSNGATRYLHDVPQETLIDDEYRASRFFDDETISDVHTDEACSKYRLWKSRYLDVYKRFIPESLDLPNIKIAILDTGIDIEHLYIDARRENIKGIYNWLSEDEPADVRVATDMSGHGTFAASLILDYAPDAQLYVAKIADETPSNASLIAKAIHYAVSNWKVDIISMSFGFPTCEIDGYHEIQEAITNAHANHVLLFAAASNSGGKLGRAYPARDQDVIAVHSTDTNGNRSSFSPTALSHDINLATVGEAVESAWPMHLPHQSNSKFLRCKSGTSFATPIAAGIAGFLLLYAKINLSDKAHALKRRQKMQALLMRVAEKEMGQKTRDDYHFIDLSLHKTTLFGQSKEIVDATIRHILST